MITHKDIYRCYSANLMQFLSKNAIQYILIAKDVVTDRKFWAYEKTESFEVLLNEWIKNNPKK